MGEKKVFKNLSKIKARKVDWFWHPIIPNGMITIVEGDPGEGKSYLAMHLAALVSSGGKLPDGTKLDAKRVMYISSEDEASYTIRPRIDHMKGNSNKISVQVADLDFGSDGIEAIRAELDRGDYGLIIIDPFVAYLPAGADPFRSTTIRPILGELKKIVEEYACAMILIRHLTKMKHDKAIYQGGGSMDFIGAVRSALLVTRSPENPNQRLLMHIKENVGPKGKTWVFEMRDNGKDKMPSFFWCGQSDITVNDLAQLNSPSTPRPADNAEEFLQIALANGRMKATEIQTLAEKNGIKSRTLNRAKKSIGIESEQKSGHWVWLLPKAAAKKR